MDRLRVVRMPSCSAESSRPEFKNSGDLKTYFETKFPCCEYLNHDGIVKNIGLSQEKLRLSLLGDCWKIAYSGVMMDIFNLILPDKSIIYLTYNYKHGRGLIDWF